MCENCSFQRASVSPIITKSIRWTLLSKSVDVFLPVLSLKGLCDVGRFVNEL